MIFHFEGRKDQSTLLSFSRQPASFAALDSWWSAISAHKVPFLCTTHLEIIRHLGSTRFVPCHARKTPVSIRSPTNATLFLLHPPLHQPDPRSLLNIPNFLPSTPKILLPKTNLIVPLTDRENVSAKTPTRPPQYAVEFERRTFPLALAFSLSTALSSITCPYSQSLVLGSRGNVRLQ